jgi:uncharacterized cupin superfamily protein
MPNQRSVIETKTVKARIGSGYPPEYAEPCKAREKRALGDMFDLSQFGVNLVTLPPGSWSSLRHWHETEDEFVYVLEGELTLVDNDGEHVLKPGMCAGFKAGISNGHHLVNKTGKPATYLEVGTRAESARAFYSDIDMRIEYSADGSRQFLRRNGLPY